MQRPLDDDPAGGALAERPLLIEAAPGVRLAGDLRLPVPAGGLVVFAHGSGSSRLSPRNRRVAEALSRRGLATLLFDLLTPVEEADRENIFDIDLLGERLLAATRWLEGEAELARLPRGFFGASTGAAAALWAAARLGESVGAVVSRGGRPDLAAESLPLVTAPTLLIVGGLDREVLELNREAAAMMSCEHEIAVVPGATHLFEEPGALGQVERLAGSWLSAHLSGG